MGRRKMVEATSQACAFRVGWTGLSSWLAMVRFGEASDFLMMCVGEIRAWGPSIGSVPLELLGSLEVKISLSLKDFVFKPFLGQPASENSSRFGEATIPQLSTASRAPTETLYCNGPIPACNYGRMPPKEAAADRSVFPACLPRDMVSPVSAAASSHHSGRGVPAPFTAVPQAPAPPPDPSWCFPRSVPWRKDRPWPADLVGLDRAALSSLTWA
jgi:hypothetical protein